MAVHDITYLFIYFCGPRASHCCGLSRCGAQAPDTQAQRPWLTGPPAPRHVGSSRTRARTHVPCIGRRTLNHCATREAPPLCYLFLFIYIFFAVHGPLTAVASPVAEHRLWMRRLTGHGSRAQPLRGMWDLPGPGHKPVSPSIGRWTLNHCTTREALINFLEHIFHDLASDHKMLL